MYVLFLMCEMAVQARHDVGVRLVVNTTASKKTIFAMARVEKRSCSTKE
jgi:hypothetical protein